MMDRIMKSISDGIICIPNKMTQGRNSFGDAVIFLLGIELDVEFKLREGLLI